MHEFGRELRRLRELAGLTQIQFAARLGYHHTYVSKIESGTREPRIEFAAKADDALAAGGALLAAATKVRANSAIPLPSAPRGAEPLRLPRSGLIQLPAFGITCPSHGTDGCAALIPGGLTGVPGVDGRAVGIPTLHGFAALLATYVEADVSAVGGDLAVPVERALNALLAVVPKARGDDADGLMRLAARYADVAGWLRVKRGQHGIAMAWLLRSTEWALASGGLPTACEALSHISVLSMLEGDGATALEYARAASEVDPDRRWISVQGQLHQARAYALLGDHREFDRQTRAARRGAELLAERDVVEAPWLTGVAGDTFIASHLAGGLRDLAEVIGGADRADQAALFAEKSLTTVPADMHGSRLLLTLRLADSQACRGDLDAAVEIARPVIPAVSSTAATPIRRELGRLRTRLGTRFDELLGDHA
ncbi:hypothetical protein UK23_17140 [Lentzea aerocolonigenes]|uniref:HTH cro/C1-type domain-containing protein n=1 Tax=Lentzea aerocolonigenes TaxID=68170 RepID=A0A0F0H2A9_LENAE|nr:helix-turn-helix transcriptional regulator [Lentzea aerocolonigenes]KJK48387.1 hypothetical protein UK23_17140 [Lentzea aerocolonigenes]